MAVLGKVTALLFVVDNDDFWSAADLDQSTLDGSLGNIRGADSGVLAIINQENLVKSDGIAFFVVANKLLNGDSVTF